jgi:hypothetical protein
MHGRVYAQPLHLWLATGWVDEVGRALAATGVDPQIARARARLGVAATRGLLLELGATGDRAAADAAMQGFTELMRRATKP